MENEDENNEEVEDLEEPSPNWWGVSEFIW